jgi:hypothetical protein
MCVRAQPAPPKETRLNARSTLVLLLIACGPTPAPLLELPPTVVTPLGCNPGFEGSSNPAAPPECWSASGPAGSDWGKTVRLGGASGSGFVSLVAGADGWPAIFSDSFEVRAGQGYSVHARIRTTAGLDSTIGVLWYDAAGELLASPREALVLAAPAWFEVDGPARPAPAEAVRGRLFAQAPPRSAIDVDDLELFAR